jgi:hypothetical protein
MKNSAREIIDDVSGTLLGLISVFDMLGSVEAPKFRDITVSEFSFFMRKILDDVYQKVNSISLSRDR